MLNLSSAILRNVIIAWYSNGSISHMIFWTFSIRIQVLAWIPNRKCLKTGPLLKWHLNTGQLFTMFDHFFDIWRNNSVFTSHLNSELLFDYQTCLTIWIPDLFGVRIPIVVSTKAITGFMNLNLDQTWRGGISTLIKKTTVGIRLSDMSGNPMAQRSLIAEWSVNWMVTWITDKKSGNWMVTWQGEPFGYQTFCPVTEWWPE